MNKFTALSVAAALAVSFATLSNTALAAERASAPANKVSGEKIDSGLGDLPHYSQWADPTGRNPLRRASGASCTRAATRCRWWRARPPAWAW